MQSDARMLFVKWPFRQNAALWSWRVVFAAFRNKVGSGPHRVRALEIQMRSLRWGPVEVLEGSE